ncbi:MAG: hypothetical protein R8K50_09950 [Mariprofundus sp.]
MPIEYTTDMKDRHGNILAVIDFPGILCEMNAEQITRMIIALNDIKNEIDDLNSQPDICR